MPLWLQVLLQPALVSNLTLRDWDRWLPLWRRYRLLGRLQAVLQEQKLLSRVPPPVRPHLQAAAMVAEHNRTQLDWETRRIQRTLAHCPAELILLKGAAYQAAELPCARGRLAADVDILVPEDALGAVERALCRAGWETVKLNDYDQQYYRRWMHELPPLRHRLRGTEVDVHHTILPRTSRLSPDPALIRQNARPLANRPGLKIPAPADLVLHGATHAFYDGDFSGGPRDLLDIHDLLCHFAPKEVDFWITLVRRARELGLQLPLYHALHFSRKLLHTPVPPEVFAGLSAGGPKAVSATLMNTLTPRVLLADHPPSPAQRLAQHLLYLRSHWLRMPPSLLLTHLGRKAWRRWRLLPAGTAHNETR